MSAEGIPVDNVETQEGNNYLGFSELVTYLKDQARPSYSGFLRRYREVVVASSLAEVGTKSTWKMFDVTWFRRFSFSGKANLDNLEKVNRERAGLESYWKDVMEECELRKDLSIKKDQRDHLNTLITEVEDRLSGIAQRWDNLDDEEDGNNLDDEDDTHDPPAPIEEAGTSNGDSSHLFDFQEEILEDDTTIYDPLTPSEDAGTFNVGSHLLNSQEEEIPDIDGETPELTEGVRQLNISQPEPKRVRAAVWGRQRLSTVTGENNNRALRPVGRVSYTELLNRRTSKKRKREPVPERSTSRPLNSLARSRQSDVDFGHVEPVDLGDENVDLSNVEMDSVHSSGASDEGPFFLDTSGLFEGDDEDDERPRKRTRCLRCPIHCIGGH